MSPDGTLTRLQGSDSRPLTRQGTVTAALRLIGDESCDRGEWTGEGKADSIKSQRQETQLGVIGTPRHGEQIHVRMLTTVILEASPEGHKHSVTS